VDWFDPASLPEMLPRHRKYLQIAQRANSFNPFP